MLKNVDVVFLEEVDGRPHLEWARPVIEAGKPLFIDKPLAGSLADCIEIFRLAKEKNVPCFSSSSLRFGSRGCQALRSGDSAFGEIKSCTAWSPMSIEPHHPDLFWYGIHGCEILFTVMGPGCKTVTREAQEKVVGVWADGRTGTFVGQQGYGAEVVGTKGSGTAGKYEGYKPMVVEICKFFKTGKPPVSMEETLEIYTFMEAADESKRQGGKPVSMDEVFKKAQAASAAAVTSEDGGQEWATARRSPAFRNMPCACFELARRSLVLIQRNGGFSWPNPTNSLAAAPFAPRPRPAWPFPISFPPPPWGRRARPAPTTN